jgi:hypothetical protein
MQWFRSPLTALSSGIVSVLAVAFLVGCGGCSEENEPAAPAGGSAASTGGEKKPEPAATGTPAAAAVDPATAATITGKVNFTGNPPPPPPPIPVTADAYCMAAHKDAPLFPEEIVINGNKTLRWVLVYVSAGLEGKTFPVPAEPVTFDQRGCHYEPHVFGIQAKQKLEVLNSDATNHNVHALPKKNHDFNVGMPTQGMKIPTSFANPEVPVKIKCEVHNWMSAYCGVFSHPYFAVSDAQGNFKIANLPPGKYTLTAWHEKYGEKKQEIEVAPKDTKTVEFEYKGS